MLALCPCCGPSPHPYPSAVRIPSLPTSALWTLQMTQLGHQMQHCQHFLSTFVQGDVPDAGKVIQHVLNKEFMIYQEVEKR